MLSQVVSLTPDTKAFVPRMALLVPQATVTSARSPPKPPAETGYTSKILVSPYPHVSTTWVRMSNGQ